MLVLPPGHAQEVARGRRLSVRERRLVGVVAAVTAALIVAVVVSLAFTGASSRNGCIHASYAGPVGAERVDSCGSAARQMCASIGTPGGLTGDAATTIADACRKAGLTVGG